MNFILNAHDDLSQKIRTLGIKSWQELTQYVRSLPYRLNTFNFDGVFQYGSNFEKEWKCRQDGVAPQARINGLGEGRNVFIPMEKIYKDKRKFVPAHLGENFDWIFVEDDAKSKIKKR
jgi:hypothetical protein